VSQVCQRIAVAELIAQADRLREALLLLGPDRMAQVDPGLIPRLRLVPVPAEPENSGS